MKPARYTFPCIILAALGICAFASYAHAEWKDYLKMPDPSKRVDFQDKKFEPRNAPIDKSYPEKSYRGTDKSFSGRDFPSKNFSAGRAATADKKYPDSKAAASDKSFNARSWEGSKEYPAGMAPQSGKVSQFADKQAPVPEFTDVKKNFGNSRVLSEEEARRLMQELYGGSKP